MAVQWILLSCLLFFWVPHCHGISYGQVVLQNSPIILGELVCVANSESVKSVSCDSFSGCRGLESIVQFQQVAEVVVEDGGRVGGGLDGGRIPWSRGGG